jgi:hypothetical protein
MATNVVLETPNVAVSAGPLGTVVGAQLAAVFQSAVFGDACHVALSAKVVLSVENKSASTAAARRKVGVQRRRGEMRAFLNRPFKIGFPFDTRSREVFYSTPIGGSIFMLIT